jgi:hypothetical protein
MSAADMLLTRRLGVKVEGVEDIARAVSGLKGDERGSVDYAVARRSIIALAREFGDEGLKALPDAWQVTPDSDGIEYKALPATATQITDAAEGIVTAFVAVSGTEDKVADIIYDEALDYAKAARTPKGVWHHDWTQPIAKTLKVDVLHAGDPNLPRATRDGAAWPTTAGAFKVETQFNLNTQRGREALADVIFYGDEQEWSIGYKVPPGGAKVDKQGVRHIKQLVINEYSPVLFGAHPLTSTGSIKHEGASVWRDDSDEWQEQKGGTISVYLSGSLEEQIDAVEDAVGDYLTSLSSGINMGMCWARVVGTFATSPTSGRCIFDVITFGDYGGEDGDDTPDLDDDDNYFSATWSADPDGTVTLSNVQPVTIQVSAALKDDGATPEERRIAEFLLGGRKAEWDPDGEVKVGKVFSKKNLTAIRDAHAALGALLAAADPKPAAATDDTGGKADDAPGAQPHPYLADNGVCGTCGSPATARVHGFQAKADADAMKKKPHSYVAPASGSDCATCGQQSDSPMHNAAKDDLTDAAGTHPYQAGENGLCTVCGSVMGDQIHEGPYPAKDEPDPAAKADDGEVGVKLEDLPPDVVRDILTGERLAARL